MVSEVIQKKVGQKGLNERGKMESKWTCWKKGEEKRGGEERRASQVGGVVDLERREEEEEIRGKSLGADWLKKRQQVRRKQRSKMKRWKNGECGEGS